MVYVSTNNSVNSLAETGTLAPQNAAMARTVGGGPGRLVLDLAAGTGTSSRAFGRRPINAMADVCDATGADVLTLTKAIGHDLRIGARGMSAGLGFGGGCLPKDLRALLARAEELGVAESLEFLRAVDAVNMRRRERTVRVAESLVGGALTGRTVAVLGAAFKPHTDDVRDSPALAVAAAMHLDGALVRVHDPAAIDNARAVFPDLEFVAEAWDACTDADLVLHLTEWPVYREIETYADSADGWGRFRGGMERESCRHRPARCMTTRLSTRRLRNSEAV